jgi:hypothetical protein
VLAIEYRWRGSHLLTLHNLSADNVTVRLPGDLGAAEGDAEPRGAGTGDAKMRQVLGDEPPPAGPGQEMTLGRYGFRWLLLAAGSALG